jgi:hypothetical protein
MSKGNVMDYSAIKLIHVTGIMLVFMGLGGMVFASAAGFGPPNLRLRRAAALLHGVGLAAILVSGVMMLSDLGLLHGDPPGWAKAKFVIFLLIGGSLSLAARMSRMIWFLVAGWIILGAAAAYLALYKPF